MCLTKLRVLKAPLNISSPVSLMGTENHLDDRWDQPQYFPGEIILKKSEYIMLNRVRSRGTPGCLRDHLSSGVQSDGQKDGRM